jgi:hypothetical protein
LAQQLDVKRGLVEPYEANWDKRYRISVRCYVTTFFYFFTHIGFIGQIQ